MGNSYVITNIKKLVNVFSEIKGEFEKAGNAPVSINLTWEKSHRNKTISQLGFYFGGVIKAIQNHFKEFYGKEYEIDTIKEMLYNECGTSEEFICPNGKILTETKRISRMTVEEMSEFIEKSINFCDEYGIVLQPELRYLWVNNLNPKFVEEVRETKFPEKDAEYLAEVHKETCLICGKGGVEAHHAKLPELAGLGDKTPDYMAVPLCPTCHRYLNAGGHISTEKLLKLCPFIFKHLDLKAFCKLRYKRWLEHK